MLPKNKPWSAMGPIERVLHVLASICVAVAGAGLVSISRTKSMDRWLRVQTPAAAPRNVI